MRRDTDSLDRLVIKYISQFTEASRESERDALISAIQREDNGITVHTVYKE